MWKCLFALIVISVMGCEKLGNAGGGGDAGEQSNDWEDLTFELVSRQARQWDSLLVHSQGDIYLVESGMSDLVPWGPVGLVSRVSPYGNLEDQATIDPGSPLHVHDIAEHPDSGLVLVGTRDYGGYTSAYVARVSFKSRGSVTWSQEFGTGESHEDSAFLGLVGVPDGYHLFGYGGANYGDHVAFRTFVDTSGAGGEFTLEFERSEGDSSEFVTGASLPDGDVLIVGSYGDFEEIDWLWNGHVLLIRGDEVRYRKLKDSSELTGGGSGHGRLYVYGHVRTDESTYASDVYLAELDKSDLRVVWQKQLDYLHEDYIVAGDVSSNGEIVLAWRAFERNVRTTWIGKYDQEGNEQWKRSFVNREIRDVAFAKNGEHIFACGLAAPEKDGQDLHGWLIKLDEDGVL